MKRRPVNSRIKDSMGQIPAWLLGAALIYFIWPKDWAEEGVYVEIPLLFWSIFYGQNFLKALFPKAPEREWQVYAGGVIAFFSAAF